MERRLHCYRFTTTLLTTAKSKSRSSPYYIVAERGCETTAAHHLKTKKVLQQRALQLQGLQPASETHSSVSLVLVLFALKTWYPPCPAPCAHWDGFWALSAGLLLGTSRSRGKVSPPRCLSPLLFSFLRSAFSFLPFFSFEPLLAAFFSPLWLLSPALAGTPLRFVPLASLELSLPLFWVSFASQSEISISPAKLTLPFLPLSLEEFFLPLLLRLYRRPQCSTLTHLSQ